VLILPPPQKLGVETHLPAQACSQSPSAGSSSLVPAGQAGPPQIPGAKSSAGGAGPRNMVCGALWCIGGIVVTVATYSAAEPGGTYLVAWGAILFGGLEFLQGLWQTSTEL
jgi:hypothetical protein